MIEIVQGVGVGSGKTNYVVADRVIPHLVRGGTVCSSDKFQLQWEPLCKLAARRFNVVLEPDQWRTVPAEDVYRLHELTPPGSDECPVLIIIDEAQSSLHTRDSKDKHKRELFDWACESRHDNNDLIFISQHALNIDVQVRRLATNIIRVWNMATFKIAGMGMPRFLITMGFGFMVIVMDQSEKVVQDRRWLPHDKEVFGCYVSKSCKGTHKRLGGLQALEVQRKQLQKAKIRKKKSPMFKVMVIVLVVALGVGAFAVPKVYGMLHKAPRSVDLAKVDGKGAAPAGAVKPASPKRYAEIYLSYSGEYGIGEYYHPPTLVTDHGTYIQGELSSRGMVVMLRRPSSNSKLTIARIDDCGTAVFVIADDGQRDAGQEAVMRKPALVAEK